MDKNCIIIAQHPTGSELYYRGTPAPSMLSDSTDKVWVGAMRWDEALEMTDEEATALLPVLQEKLTTRTVVIVRRETN